VRKSQKGRVGTFGAAASFPRLQRRSDNARSLPVAGHPAALCAPPRGARRKCAGAHRGRFRQRRHWGSRCPAAGVRRASVRPPDGCIRHTSSARRPGRRPASPGWCPGWHE